MNVKYKNEAKRVTKMFSSDNLEPVICISPQIDRQGENFSFQQFLQPATDTLWSLISAVKSCSSGFYINVQSREVISAKKKRAKDIHV
jgi:hypothetical protein